jgi:hypothetical protein
MKFIQRYIELLKNSNNFVGGEITDKTSFYSDPPVKWMNHPNVWHISNNGFYRNKLVLKLLKLTPDTLRDVIFNGKPEFYEIFISSILISLPKTATDAEHPPILNILQSYTEEFDKHLKKYENAQFLAQVPDRSQFYVFVTNLIEFFREAYIKIDRTLRISNIQETRKATKTKNLFYAFEILWNQWCYSIDRFNNSVWDFIKSDATRDLIEIEYNKLTESSVITYIKVRADKLPGDPYRMYNQYFNIYTDDSNSNPTLPKSFFLSGPNPNKRLPLNKDLIKGAFAETAATKTIDEIENLNDIVLEAILTEDTTKAILPQHMTDNLKKFAEYDPTTDPDNSLRNNLKSILHKDLKTLLKNATSINFDADGNVINMKNFEYGNLYGPFTKVFTPEDSNTDISTRCTHIIEKLQKKENVFVLGYGASGAGKTSALIYFKKGPDGQKDGILLNILKNLKIGGNSINNLTVTIQEFYDSKDNSETNIRNNTSNILKNEYMNIGFIKDVTTNEYIIDTGGDDGKRGTINNLTRTVMTEDEDNAATTQALAEKNAALAALAGNPTPLPTLGTGPEKALLLNSTSNIKWDNKQYNWSITSNEFTINDPRFIGSDPSRKVKTLGDFIFTVVDTVRMISPTPNNPQSSRSHVLISIKLGGSAETANYLIFGDLAGVENSFDCGKLETQTDFLNLKLLDPTTGKPLTSLLSRYKPDGNKIQSKNQLEQSYYTKTNKLIFNDVEIAKFKQYLPIFNYNSKTKVASENPDDIKKRDLIQNYCQIYLEVLRVTVDPTNIGVFNNFKPPIFKIILNKIYNDKISSSDKNFYDSSTVKTITSQNYIAIKAKIIELLAALGIKFIFPLGSTPDQEEAIKETEMKNIVSLYVNLAQNREILRLSGVEEFCKDRKAEGDFINRSLYGMKNDIRQIVSELSSNDDALISNLPLVKETCFKYFCNQDHAHCYSQVKKASIGIQTIISEIKTKLGSEKPKLSFVLFGVINISVHGDPMPKDDPPRVPYIDLLKIKLARDEYLTYQYYSNQNQYYEFKDLNRNKFADVISNEFYGKPFNLLKDDELNDPCYGSILHTVYFFKDTIEGLIGPLKISFKNIKFDHDFLKNCLEFITQVENINSLSIPGTIDFMNELKNIFSTDMNCNLMKDDARTINLLEEDVSLYNNIVTKTSLGDVITNQNENEKISVYTQSAALAANIDGIRHGNPSTAKVAVPTLSPFLGGNYGINTEINNIINKGGSSNKKELINEYKKLKKLYKKLI